MASQSGVYGDNNFKCIVLHDGTVIVVERKKDGGRDLTRLDNPSGKATTVHLDAPSGKEGE